MVSEGCEDIKKKRERERGDFTQKSKVGACGCKSFYLASGASRVQDTSTSSSEVVAEALGIS